MKLHVYFTPAELTAVAASANDVYIVIDVIRATTSLAVIFDQGASRVYAADSVEQAEMARQCHPARLLCGERRALPLPGFDYGNSPIQFAQAALHERELILTTTNGSRAFFACPAESARLAGCFYNAAAVSSQALRLAAERDGNIALVCAGVAGYFALDDSVCAGYLAQELQRQQPALQLHESVLAAQAIYQNYAPPKLLEYGNSVLSVINAGLSADLDMCMQVSVSRSVPLVVGREAQTGLLVLERLR